MEIAYFSFRGIDLASKIQFYDNNLSIVANNDPDYMSVDSQYQALLKSFTELSALYITDQKNPLSQELVVLDNQRDTYLRGLWLLVEGQTHSPLPQKQDAANKLLRNLSLFATSASAFVYQSYEKETANIINLLNGWKDDEVLKAAHSTLELAEITNALEESNRQHNEVWLKRNQSYAEQTSDKSGAKQSECEAAYRNLCKAINAYAFVTPRDDYEKTIQEMNALIDKTVLLRKQSEGHKKKSQNEFEPLALKNNLGYS